MKKLNKLLHPHPVLILFLVLASAAGLAWIFFDGRENTVLAYGFYPLCAYSLCVLCLWLLPWLIRYIKQPKKVKSPVDQENAFRRSLFSGLGMNLLYAGHGCPDRLCLDRESGSLSADHGSDTFGAAAL